MTYSITITKTLDAELFDDIIETAGYGIGYWAQTLTHDIPSETVRIVFDGDDFDDDSPLATGEKTITHQGITDAIESLLKGDAKCGNYILEQLRDYLNGEPTLDTDLADVIIQVATLGEIVYG
jgi:hypothetical protein